MEKVEPRNVSIYPAQWAIIDGKATEIGNSGNTSAGLKALVAEYERLRAIVDGNGQPIDRALQSTPDQVPVSP